LAFLLLLALLIVVQTTLSRLRKHQAPGAHSTGRAIDIAVQGEKAHQLLKKAFSMGIGGIGVNQKGSGRFIHLDDLDETDNHTRPWVWSY
jgi:zinc D-Ala-D-Ala carboxypeptidase